MNILVTGGAGFIGSHLVRSLQEDGHKISVLDDLSTGDILSLPPNITFAHETIENKEACSALCKNVDIVFHLAAIASMSTCKADPDRTYNTNVIGTDNVLKASREAGVKRFVFASSSAVYGNATRPISEVCRPMPISEYGRHKRTGEMFCEMMSNLWGPAFSTVSLRLFNVYGPGQMFGDECAVIPAFDDAIQEERRPVIYGDGSQTRDFVHVDDVVRAFKLAATHNITISHRIFNIGSSVPISINDLWSKCRTCAGVELDPEYLDARAGDIQSSCADIELAKSVLGWTPEIDLEEGLSQMIGSV